MWKIIILMDPAKYSYHTTVSRQIQFTLESDGHTVTILNINSCVPDHECLHKIIELQPDVLITLDLAGFRFRTQAGEIALNMLPTKNLNLIWGNKPEYAPLLRKKLSLSMLFYDVSGADNRLTELYPNLLYYRFSGTLDSFPQIWSDFTRDVQLQ